MEIKIPWAKPTVGQEEMKLALQLNVIDPKIGGVMIMGDRGTGKSTTIRAIADLLPEIEVKNEYIANNLGIEKGDMISLHYFLNNKELVLGIIGDVLPKEKISGLP